MVCKVNSWQSMNMITDYAGHQSIREFSCKIDLSNIPSEVMITDDLICLYAL